MSRGVLVAAAADAAAVLVFVLVGRRSHAEGVTLAGTASTAWPFLVALALAWAGTWAVATLSARAGGATSGLAPTAVVPTGLLVWAGTVAAGLGLRAVSGGGTPVSFSVVTALVLGALMLGWRAVAALARRRATA